MIPLHEPRFDSDDENLVLETLRTSWVSTGGPHIDQFEKDIAKFVGANFAVSTTNGTIALQLMIEVLKRQQKIESKFQIIVPNLSFIATANAIVNAGGEPVFIDTAPHSMNLSCELLKSCLSTQYRSQSDGLLYCKETGLPLLAVMPVHVMGWAGEILQIAEICKNFNIPMLEDAAESLGSYHLNGNHLGLSGIASAFSFNGNKILTTGGGGMIVTNDGTFAKRAKHLSTTAKTDNLNYFHDEVGYNFRLVNILGALGVSQLRTLPKRLSAKRNILERYYLGLRNCPEVEIYREDTTNSNNWLVNILLPDLETRTHVLNSLLESKIGARPLWAPFNLQPALSRFPQFASSWPNSKSIWERSLSLPSSPHLTFTQIDEIASVIRDSIDKLKPLQGKPR